MCTEYVVIMHPNSDYFKVQDPLRMVSGVRYGADVSLKTLMDEASNSVNCIQAQQCLPLGGYSDWASMPPLQPNTATRQQILVLAHWDGNGLFRSRIEVWRGMPSTSFLSGNDM